MWATQMGHTDVGADQNISNLNYFLRQEKSLEGIFTVLCLFSNCGSISKC